MLESDEILTDFLDRPEDPALLFELLKSWVPNYCFELILNWGRQASPIKALDLPLEICHNLVAVVCKTNELTSVELPDGTVIHGMPIQELNAVLVFRLVHPSQHSSNGHADTAIIRLCIELFLSQRALRKEQRVHEAHKRQLNRRFRVLEAKYHDILEESTRGYQTLLESSSDAIVMLDEERNIVSCNQSFLDLFGYEQSEVDGKSIRIIHQSDESFQSFGKHAYPAIAKTGTYRAEWEFARKDRTLRPVETVTSVIKSSDGVSRGYVAIIRDISDRKKAEQKRAKLEAQLRHAQKMESIGTLAGGIAHNFNNLLMTIQGNTSLMLLDNDAPHPHYERLNCIKRSVESGARLTSELLGYARKGKYEVLPLDLNQLIKGAIETFGSTRKDIRIDTDLSVDLYRIEADYGQIEQVVWNLFVNAADAMPNGGDLFLTTKNVSHTDMVNKPYTPKPRAYVQLKIQDTGVGMDEKTMERIFEPFFTTKGLERGTGLGLSSVYGIVKGHGGYIDVESKKGSGATFVIYLPASEKAAKKVKEERGELMKGNASVLLVDDEEMVLDVGKKMLEKLGYDVLSAKTAQESLGIFEKKGDEIDLVILDMIMPEMSGGQIYDQMKAANPTVKVLLSSGYSIDGQATEILERGCNGFIQKPFNLKELSVKIGEVLNSVGSE